MSELVKYDEACRQLAAAVAVDEVLEIRNKAQAMRVYARQAKNRELEINAAKVRVRAERRLGEMILEQKATIGLAKGGQPYQGDSTCSDAEQVERPQTLAEAGIDRKLSTRAQRTAEIPPDRFAELLGMIDRQDTGRVIVDVLKIDAENEQREKRRNLAIVLSDASAALPTGRLFPCAYIDPPWQRKQGVTDRSYENHYPTMSWDEIIALCERVAKILQPDNWVFLWIPRAHLLALHPVEMEFADDDGRVIKRTVKLPLAWAVARALGCDNYSTCYIWTKTDEEHPHDQGGGVLVFDQDEILLQFKRGRGLPKPATDEKFKSNHRERKREHSRKPDHYREMIRTMTGGVPVLELFARVDAEHPLPPDWQAWGNQAQVSVELPAEPPIEVEAPTPAPVDALVLGSEIKCVRGSISKCDDLNECALRGDCKFFPFLPKVPASKPNIESLSEFQRLKAFSDFCFPDRVAVLTAIAPEYIERGLAYRLGGRDDWGLTDAGWVRFHALNIERTAEQRAAAAAAAAAAVGDEPPEIVDGVLQCRLPLDDDEIELQRALTAIAAGEPVDGDIARHLVGIGHAHATTTRLVITEQGRAWLSGLVDIAPASDDATSLDIPDFLKRKKAGADLPLFAGAAT